MMKKLKSKGGEKHPSPKDPEKFQYSKSNKDSERAMMTQECNAVLGSCCGEGWHRTSRDVAVHFDAAAVFSSRKRLIFRVIARYFGIFHSEK